MLAVVLVSCCTVLVFAVESSTSIDAQIKYVQDIENQGKAPIKDGSAAIEINGDTVSLDGAPDDAVTLIIYCIPADENEAMAWVTECLANIGTPLRAYVIYLLDADGNQIAAKDVAITISCSGSSDHLIVCSISAEGNAEVMESQAQKEQVMFSANGCYYYVLCKSYSGSSSTEDNGSTGASDAIEMESVPTGDNTNLCVPACLLLVSSLMIGLLLAFRIRESQNK